MAMPLNWSEVTPGLDPAAFTLVTAPSRFPKVGDLWAPVRGPAVDLPAALQHLRDTGPDQPFPNPKEPS